MDQTNSTLPVEVREEQLQPHVPDSRQVQVIPLALEHRASRDLPMVLEVRRRPDDQIRPRHLLRLQDPAPHWDSQRTVELLDLGRKRRATLQVTYDFLDSLVCLGIM